MIKVFKPTLIQARLSFHPARQECGHSTVRHFVDVGELASYLLSLFSHRQKKMKLNEDPSSDFSFPGEFSHQAVLRTDVTDLSDRPFCEIRHIWPYEIINLL